MRCYLLLLAVLVTPAVGDARLDEVIAGLRAARESVHSARARVIERMTNGPADIALHTHRSARMAATGRGTPEPMVAGPDGFARRETRFRWWLDGEMLAATCEQESQWEEAPGLITRRWVVTPELGREFSVAPQPPGMGGGFDGSLQLRPPERMLRYGVLKLDPRSDPRYHAFYSRHEREWRPLDLLLEEEAERVRVEGDDDLFDSRCRHLVLEPATETGPVVHYWVDLEHGFVIRQSLGEWDHDGVVSIAGDETTAVGEFNGVWLPTAVHRVSQSTCEAEVARQIGIADQVQIAGDLAVLPEHHTDYELAISSVNEPIEPECFYIDLSLRLIGHDQRDGEQFFLERLNDEEWRELWQRRRGR